MTATANGSPPAASPADGLLPSTWQERAAKLAHLLTELADARAHATVLHAKAYLDTEGIGAIREQAARLASVEAQRAAGHAQAEVEAYRLLLEVAGRELET
jgi:hypothetical protein